MKFQLCRRMVCVGALAASVGGCSMSGPMRVDEQAHGYAYDELPSSRWKNLQLPTSTDKAWQSTKGAALVALRSVCGRYDHVTLKALSQALVNTMQGPEVVAQDTFELDGREAMRSSVKGKVDGVDVESVFVVFRKDDCIFDFALTARGTPDPKELTDFSGFVSSFRYAGVKGDP